MPTAPAEVRLAARYLAPPVGEDGAAQLIEQLVLAPPDVAARTPRAWRTRRARSRRRSATGGSTPARGATPPCPRIPSRDAARVLPDGDAARAEAVELLRAGRIVAVPTDTVYGIAADMARPARIERLFAAKQPPARQGRRAPARRRRPGRRPRAAAARRRALLARAVLAGRPDARPAASCAASSCPTRSPAGTATIGVRVPDHDAPRALAARPRAAAHDVREPLGRARLARRRRDRRAAGRRGRPGARRRPDPRRPGLDGRRLHGERPAHPARRAPIPDLADRRDARARRPPARDPAWSRPRIAAAPPMGR